MTREEAARACANALRRIVEYGEGVGADTAERSLAAALLVLTDPSDAARAFRDEPLEPDVPYRAEPKEDDE